MSSFLTSLWSGFHWDFLRIPFLKPNLVLRMDLCDIYKCNMIWCSFLILYLTVKYYFIAGASPARSQPVVNPNHRPADYASQHHGASKPAWLLALEIVTGTMVGSLFLLAVLTAFQRCNKRASIIIPWKKSASQKEHTTVYIGSVSLFSNIYLHLIVLGLFWT